MPEDQWELTQCPHCGHVYKLPFAGPEHQVLHAVEDLARHSGAASTQAVALEVRLSEAQARRWLRKLEHKGRVRRVGERGGWRTAA
ncbi:MAG: FaeA/PapI family transcriptional regulator [Anaerolineales bacterium]